MHDYRILWNQRGIIRNQFVGPRSVGFRIGLRGVRAIHCRIGREGRRLLLYQRAYARVGGYKQTSPGVYEAYLIWGVGKLVTQSKSPDGTTLDLYCPVSNEYVLTISGTGSLNNGKCHVKIDPVISKRIEAGEEHPIRVFVQPEGECRGVYVSNKTSEGFDVAELMGGSSNVNFSWSLEAGLKEIK